MPTKLCLNMIVRNEVTNLMQSLPTVAPYVSSYVIVDTGSTDATKKYIQAFFDARGIPGLIFDEPFENFEQARNAALDAADRFFKDGPLAYDYLLLSDADMDLTVVNPECFDNLDAPVYAIEQRSGGVAYWNIRLIKNGAKARYVGVTHEYLSHDGHMGQLHGCYFADRATGSNRPNKCKRDIELLEKALPDANPSLRGRYLFYLAQSYADDGQPAKAIEYYRKRIEAGGWDEEIYTSHYAIAKMMERLGRTEEFVYAMLKAYSYRPSRGEPLYALSKFFREKENNAASVLFSRAGMELHRPGDLLFVEDHPYQVGFREDFSICGFYGPQKAQAFKVCDGIALDRDVSHGARALAATNLYWYLEPLNKYAPSFKARQIHMKWPDGYTPMNPSITVAPNGRPVVLVRTVNYKITESGHYDMQGDTAIRTRNFIGYEGEVPVEIQKPLDWPKTPQYPYVIGFEDMRIFTFRGELWASTNCRELTSEGWCEQVLMRLGPDGVVQYWHRMLPKERTTEKNWSPIVDPIAPEIRFMYKPGTVVNAQGEFTQHCRPDTLFVDEFRGGSQVIPLNGGFLAVVHEAIAEPGTCKRTYSHRFVWYNHMLQPAMVSRPFVFLDRQIEFCAGLCRPNDNGKLMLSFGVRDREAWIGELDASDVWDMLHG